MADLHDIPTDSPIRRGGWIPGLAGAAAYVVRTPARSPIPVLIAAPHGGRAYSPSLLRMMRGPAGSRIRLEDRLVDLLAEKVADETGAALLMARAPRAMIDLNRAVDEMDWTMLRRSSGGPKSPMAQLSRRARSGLGLVPRRLPGIGELWTRQLERQELQERIDGIHAPYHAELSARLTQLRAQWGAALLVDLHSMPPLGAPLPGMQAPEIVVGDRFGASCVSGLSGAALDNIAIQGNPVAHNRPYAGGYVLDRHGHPRRGMHAMQLEICRSTYLDSQHEEPGPGFDRIVELLCGLVRRLADDVVALGNAGEQPLAAE